ncbi:tripartite tricarboxylate transporter substrate binding protein [uncultured Pigmentiphaga sp.]|uniref:Bug family tripartite tricarboxylate transporter substrate binding protein n=1 Tax=uncultured Pigmentiphaga sp. TaxID=340361 RepID=UPI0026135AB7|nr:tripartite tricarboxylate transporter substrate binding protein [uncultured Pigmentiphaga sp.]
MNIDRRRRALALGAMALPLAATVPPARAADKYPSRPIRIIVPLAPGGSADTICRLLANGLAKVLGQPVVVENRPGAGGLTGLAEVARSAADGYTLGYSLAGALTVAPHIARKMPYDPFKDLVPVSQVIGVPEILVANPRTGAKILGELVSYAKANPGKLNFGSAGNATIPHLGGELFKRVAGVEMVHVPYRGSGPALNDLLAGQVQFMVSDITLVRSHIEAGRLTGLAVAGPRRVPQLPNLPTTAEAGLPAMQVSNWHGMVAPAGLSPALLPQLHDAIVKAMALPELKERIDSEGAEIVASSSADFGAFLKQESAKWGGLVKELGIQWD